MAAISTGLGKGLDALIRETSEARDLSGVQVLLIKDIIPNLNQPRRKFNEKALEELAASIRSQGILQPLLVRPCGPACPLGARYSRIRIPNAQLDLERA